jgi:hypothetical protein
MFKLFMIFLIDPSDSKVEYHHLLVKARKFLGAVTAIENFEIEHVSRSKNNETGVAMTSLLPSSEEANREVDERGQYLADEMTFSNIAGVVAAAEKVQCDN